MTTQQAVEKTKEKLYEIVRKIFDDGLRSPTIGEKIETPEYYVEQLSSLIDEEKKQGFIEGYIAQANDEGTVGNRLNGDLDKNQIAQYKIIAERRFNQLKALVTNSQEK